MSGRTVTPLTDEVRNAARSSAVLAVIMTPAYLSSRWCMLERKEWAKSLTLRAEKQNLLNLKPNHFLAIARSERTNDNWPKEFLDPYREQPIGVLFYDQTSKEPIVRPYGWPIISSKTEEPFRNHLVQYAGIIRSMLHKFQDLLSKNMPIKKEEAGSLILREFLNKTGISLPNLNLYLTSTNRREIQPNSAPCAEALRSLVLLDQLFDAGQLSDFFNEYNIPVIVDKKPDINTIREETRRNVSSDLLSLDDETHLNIYSSNSKE